MENRTLYNKNPLVPTEEGISVPVTVRSTGLVASVGMIRHVLCVVYFIKITFLKS